MGWMDAFIQREPAKTVPQQPTKKAATTTSASPITYKESGSSDSIPQTQTTSTSFNSGNATQDALDYFNNLLKQKNLPGTDYYEFADTLKNKAFAVIPSEEARFSAVFAGLQATGLTKAKLLDTANQYLSIIDDDIKNIESSFDSAYKDKVQSKRDAIAQKNQQMQALSKQIQDLTAETVQLGLDATESENTLNSNKASLESAGQMAKDAITANIAKIQNFITEE